MGKRIDYYRKRYQRKRRELIKILGSVCAICGSKRKLEFGHKLPRTWKASKFNRLERLKKYRLEAEKGIVQLECAKCNRKKGPFSAEYEKKFLEEWFKD